MKYIDLGGVKVIVFNTVLPLEYRSTYCVRAHWKFPAEPATQRKKTHTNTQVRFAANTNKKNIYLDNNNNHQTKEIE